MTPIQKVGFLRRAADGLLDLLGRPLAWGAFKIIELRERIRPGAWHVTDEKKGDDRDE